jgi:aspartyl-tRNA(Asn)/glutamyl-tRNA(Gln) amidotransferase subunit A
MRQRHRQRSLRDLASEMEAGTLRSTDLVEEALEVHTERDPALGAFCAWAGEAALQEARLADEVRLRFGVRGPLHGLPISVKDHFGLRQVPTWAGTARELPRRFRREGPVVRLLRRQAAVVTGKTVAVELAFGGIGINPHFGSPKNPWDPKVDRVCGGSSSGAGVSLWEGSARLALGTDTAGSCRIPASMTGVVGLKTTKGRWPTGGVVPLSPTLDTVGLLARSVQDVIFGFAALEGGAEPARDVLEVLGRLDARDESPRLGVVREQLWDGCSPGVAEAVESALSSLGTGGLSVVERALPEAREAEQLLRCGSVVSAELDEFLESELPAWRELIDPTVASRIADGGGITAREYLGRQRRLKALARSARRRFEAVDVLACPTVPNTPPPVAELAELPVYREQNFLSLRNTCVANFLGLCALTLPVGLDRAGLPVGLQLLAPGGAEPALLRAGAALEARLGPAAERIGEPGRIRSGSTARQY